MCECMHTYLTYGYVYIFIYVYVRTLRIRMVDVHMYKYERIPASKVHVPVMQGERRVAHSMRQVEALVFSLGFS